MAADRSGKPQSPYSVLGAVLQGVDRAQQARIRVKHHQYGRGAQGSPVMESVAGRGPSTGHVSFEQCRSCRAQSVVLALKTYDASLGKLGLVKPVLASHQEVGVQEPLFEGPQRRHIVG